MSEIQSKWN